MTSICKLCKALKFKDERQTLCCCNGKINIEKLEDPPIVIRDLLTSNDTEGKHFRCHTRAYNSAFSMTSFGAEIIRQPGFNPTFTIRGQVYHRIGSLLPMADESHQFVQLYFITDMKKQAQARKAHVPLTKQSLLLKIQQTLLDNNPYVRDFKRKVPLCNLYLTMLQQLGMKTDSFAGATGNFPELLA